MAMPHPPHDGWEGLFAAARSGDSAAQGRLLEGYRNYLELLARLRFPRRLQGKADEQDLVQETFRLAYQRLPQFRGASEFEFLAWLRVVLAHELAKLVRRYCGTECRDVDLEQEFVQELNRS